MAIEVRQLTVKSNVSSAEPRLKLQLPERERERLKRELLAESREAMKDMLRLEQER
jgi:hypothetical protein